MGAIVSSLLILSAAVIATPVAVFCVEILSGLLRSQSAPHLGIRPRPRVAVLVPARNESVGIAATLQDIKAQLLPGDLAVVVADNCTDDTAAVARRAGAEVVERCEPNHIGKGYALDFGLQHLDRDPPGIVVMIDADCRLAVDTIERLVMTCATTARPVQALYLMTAADGSKVNHQVAEFAWRVKNWVRPLGLGRLAMPCPLMGAGMAFPWSIIRQADLANGWIVEDLKLGLDLAAAGHPPIFCPDALVISHFAASRRGAESQRRRWEHGHIHTILKRAAPLLRLAVTRGNFDLFSLTLDLLVPPLSLLTMLLVLMLIIAGVARFFGLGSTAFTISAVAIFAFAICVLLAWERFGRDVLPSRSVLSIPKYVFSKLGLYRQALSGKVTADWVGTDRERV